MALEIGSRLGHYDVTALIGEGGMGQVYQATDTKLNRPVALKILPEVFASDPDRLARFQREAQVLASLNHPGIAQIHGIEEQDGTQALVLELVEGPTLADRIAQGPIPVDEALPIAKQIAEALEAAHEAGVIHRDLKPANLKVSDDGTVKVLDFGLAKALDTTPEGDQSQSPTLTAAATQMGVIMGTAAYMSPEQARGKPVDKRADIWAFGVVLLEMLTGRKVFEGEDVSMTLSSVLQREPDWNALSPSVPAVLTAFLRRCLEKNPKQRVHDIADVRLALEGAFDTPTHLSDGAAPQAPRRWVAPVQWTVAALIGATLVTIGEWRNAPATASPPVTRFAVDRPPDPGFTVLENPLAISPSGMQIAHTAPQGLWLRRLESRDWILLAGTEGAFAPTFSPDDAWVAFWSDGQLKKAATDGSGVVSLGDSAVPRGARWTEDGTILIGSLGGVLKMPADGGSLERVSDFDGNLSANPHLLPSGDWMIFSSGDRVFAESLVTQERRVVVDGGTSGRYLPTGHLAYLVDGVIHGVRFDVDAVETIGGAVPLIDGVGGAVGRAYLDVSDSGHLIYSESSGEMSTLAWVDRAGKATGIPGEPFPYSDPRLSPDGGLVAVQGRVDDIDVWTYDLLRGTRTRHTTAPRQNETPVWSPDGRWLVYTWQDREHYRLFRQEIGGRTDPEELWATPSHFHVTDWTPDGSALLLDVANPDTEWDIFLLPLDGAREPEPFIQSQFRENTARVSPDGRWIAYASTETGQSEIYVEAFPDLGDRHQISSGGGFQAVWSSDGRELFYRSLDALLVVAVDPGPPISIGAPETLFEDRFLRPQGLGGHTTYDVAADGRFLMLEPAPLASDGLEVAMNWFEEVKIRLPLQ